MVMTFGGDHAELYAQENTDSVRIESGIEFHDRLEQLRCTVDGYLVSKEKMAVELVSKFPRHCTGSFPAVATRLHEGRPALLGCLLLSSALCRYCKDEVRDRKAIRGLLAAIRRTPPCRGQYDKMLQAVQANPALESGKS